MDSATLYNMAQMAGLKPVFDGVFASDKLQKPQQFPCCSIVNTDDSSRQGEHWVAFNMPEPTTVEYFDSYGFTPYIYPPFLDYINNILRARQITFNEKSVQSKDSS